MCTKQWWIQGLVSQAYCLNLLLFILKNGKRKKIIIKQSIIKQTQSGNPTWNCLSTLLPQTWSTVIHVGQRIWQPMLTGRAWEKWKRCSSFHTFLNHLKKSLLSWNRTPFGPSSIQYGKQREHLRDSSFIWWFKRCYWVVLGYTMSFCFPTFQEKVRKYLITHCITRENMYSVIYKWLMILSRKLI